MSYHLFGLAALAALFLLCAARHRRAEARLSWRRKAVQRTLAKSLREPGRA